LEAVEGGKIQPWSLSRSRRSQLTESANEKIRRRAEELFSTLQDDRKQVIDQYRPAVRVNGSVEQGRDVFSKKCSKCHKVGDIGFEVGPDLASLTNRNKLDLLTQILDPNAYIAPGYEEYVVETKDGRTIDGVVINESATAVRLRQGGGEEQTVLRSGIANLHASTVSMMPEGLEKEISIQNMTDLLEFLKNIGGPTAMAHRQP
jgi:putative heme-binding domain-containing protein